MESAEAETYEMPSYGNIAEKPTKFETSKQTVQKSCTRKLLKCSMKVAFKVACIGLLIAIVILIVSHTKDTSSPLQMRQVDETTEGNYSYQTTKSNVKGPCYNDEKGGLCVECASDERCVNGCNMEWLAAPACLVHLNQDCNLVQEYSNVNHYYTPPGYPDGRDSGPLQYVTYPKKSAGTGIRIQFNANTNAHNNAAGCSRWFVKFNGLECANPSTIEMIDSSSTPQLVRRNMDMDGICYGIANGEVNIEIWIETCSTSSDATTAWLGARQLTIMEVFPLEFTKGFPLSKPCSALTHFNLHYESWIESAETTFNTGEKSILIKAAVYYKLANDSALRIKYQAAHSVVVDTPETYSCAKWFVEVNGTLCSPYGDFAIYPHPPNQYDYYRYHSRTRTLECICENNMPAGPVLIELKIGMCPHRQSVSHVRYGDLYRPSRLLIEEVRQNKSADAILGSDGMLHRNLFTNIVRFHWYLLDSPIDNGEILSVVYTKRYSTTALKLTSSGDHRTLGSGCARWFFKINGAECGNPGVIDAVSADFYPPNMHHPMQATGYCYGLPAGIYIIAYSVSNCPGYAVADYFTGWGSAFNIFIEEVRLDYMKSCYGAICN